MTARTLRRWASTAALVGLVLAGCTGTAGTTATSPTATATATATTAATDDPTANSTATRTETATGTDRPTDRAAAREAAPSGLPECELDTLPAQAGETVDDIEAGGPFTARKDGTTFGNREGLLPPRPGGFYREYTVPTPGSRDRGARRIVTGGNPATDPQWMFYTDDHYDSFCEITGRP